MSIPPEARSSEWTPAPWPSPERSRARELIDHLQVGIISRELLGNLSKTRLQAHDLLLNLSKNRSGEVHHVLALVTQCLDKEILGQLELWMLR